MGALLKRIARATGFSKKLTRRDLASFVRRHAVSGKTLDLGCGGGPYREIFPQRVGVDVKPGPGVDIVADAHDLHAFREGEFDCLLCTEVLEHLHSPHKALAEMHRVLKPGGVIILTTRFVYPLHDVPGDYYRYTRYGLEYLLREFEILALVEETDTLGTLAVLLQRIGFQCETLSFGPLRMIWLLLARLVTPFSFVLSHEYGDIGNTSPVKSIMTSGYYVACKKKVEA